MDRHHASHSTSNAGRVVFFLDSNAGWALLVARPEAAGEPQFSLASTTDGGTRWSITQVIIPKPISAALFAPAGHVAFGDSLHGWLNLDIVSSSNFDFGALLLTSDGGRSWQLPGADPGIAGSVGLVGPEEGWLVGGPDDLRFYMTHDGAKTWQTITLPAPAGIYSAADPMQRYAATHPTYDLPTFKDSDNGFVAATYPGHLPAKSAAILFKTTDGGITWKPDRMLIGLPEGAVGWKVSSAMVDSIWVIAKARAHRPTTVINLNKGSRVNANTIVSDCTTSMACLANSQISFAALMIGWQIAAGGGRLLSTTDGGATWKTITPGLIPHSSTPVEPNPNAALLAPSTATDTTAIAPPALPTTWDQPSSRV